MTTTEDLYLYYCRRCDCKPNSKLCSELVTAYHKNGEQRLLDSIDLSNNYVGPKGVIPVLELARNIHNLTSIDLRRNMLEHEQLEMVVKAFAKHPSIARIDLSENHLMEASLENILYLLQLNENIVELRLSGNEFEPHSLDRVDAQLQKNHAACAAKRAQIAAEQQSSRSQDDAAGGKPLYLPYRSTMKVVLNEENSGGHFHFASWRRNPQYQMYLSVSTTVCITLKVQDPNPTRQFGFALLRGHSLVKVIELDPKDIVYESPFHHEQCRVTLRLDAANRARCSGPYILIPFSFNPKRSGSFELSCEIVEEPGSSSTVIADGGHISLEPLDSRFDWVVAEQEGMWSTDTSGGSIAHPSWRDNTMYHVRYEGHAAARSVATLYVVLTKSNDRDVNDEREIGFYILRGNELGPAAPTLIQESSIVATAPHQKSTSVTLKLEVSCGSLDWYILPTTQNPGEFGSFTLTVFSTCPVTMSALPTPYNWCFQTFVGRWDASHNGGCRRDNPASWVHNPSYVLSHESETPIAIAVSLEVMDLDAANNAKVATSYDAGKPIEVQVMLLQPALPDLSPMKVSAYGVTEAVFSLQHLPKGQYLLVPTTRRAGMHGGYRIRVFSASNLLISESVTLSARCREAQLAAYADENARRNMAILKLNPTNNNDSSSDQQPNVNEEFQSAAQMKQSVVAEYLAHGTLFTDRDFPRAPSSLWLGVDAPPEWAPNVFTWRRCTELITDHPVLFAPRWQVGLIRSSGWSQHDWFLSALSVVAQRPKWLARVARGYDSEYGIAQFSFFKNGQWHPVVVDDYLPVDSLDELCFSASAETKNDVFIPLLEKAYAKIHRCYEAMDQRTAPSKSLPDHFREALMDLTGGLCTSYLIDGQSPEFEGDAVRVNPKDITVTGESLWQQLVACREEDRVVALCLASDAILSQEKQHVGLVRDRLYAVVDARQVEGKRLVEIRQSWPVDDAVGAFKGSWADGAPNWTQTMKYAVDYKPTVRSFWMSFDEVSYYFTSLYITKEYKHTLFIEGGFNRQQVGGSLQSDTWIENPQYALQVLHEAAEQGGPSKVRLTVGLHQPDARCSLTREENHKLSYQTPLGLELFFTHDHSRRLVRLDGSALVLHGPSATAARDVFISTEITTNAPPGTCSQVIVMPYSVSPKSSAQYFISAWNDVAPTTMSLIQTNTRTVVEGEWVSGWCGGPPSCGTWRNNPQFLLYPSEGMEITVVLRQRNDLSSTEEHIGFTVHRAKEIRSILHYDEADVVLTVAHENAHAVTGTVRLAGMQERRGMPYVIVPTTLKAHRETGFTLEVVANKKVHLEKVPTETNWRRVVFPVSFKFAERTAGGSLHFSSWRNNPQFLIKFPYEKQGKLLVNISNHKLDDDNEVGVMCIKADEWDKGERRKISLDKSDIIQDSGSRVGVAEFETTVAIRREEPIVLMPYLNAPLLEATVTVSVYSSVDIEITPVKEWNQYLAEGSWEIGNTAGGNRKDNRSWINNPFIRLNVVKQARVYAILMQYPRGPEKLQAMLVAKQRVYLPPPITNERRKLNIGFDLVEGNDELTPIASTSHVYATEVAMMRVLAPCDREPYLIVPHSFEPEQDADFKLVVYSDEPIQVQEVAKARRYY